MSTRHISMYVNGKRVRSNGGWDKSYLVPFVLRCITQPWISDVDRGYFRNSNEYIGDKKCIYVDINYVVKHRSSRRCLRVKGIVFECEKMLKVISIDRTKETRVLYKEIDYSYKLARHNDVHFYNSKWIETLKTSKLIEEICKNQLNILDRQKEN